MARRKKSSARSANWLLLIVGMVLGVAAAVAVALFVTQAPMPFKDKASRNPPGTLLPDVANAPDPNIALYGKDGPAGNRSTAQGGNGLGAPAAGGQDPGQDGIAHIIAGLSGTGDGARAPGDTPAPAAKPAPADGLPLPPPPPPPAAASNNASTQTTYYLQTGAFRSENEAEAMLARVVLLGFPVRIETGTANQAPIHRVRVGPFKGIDEMNRARSRLGDEKIESAVVRPG
ncbi:SPOR domain-containing protein [Castellaniella sp.]|uniref:SPOR domain-containing protein n=1 Tax=Castellaniella sp. TaxID=1955812 RepID=UPI003566BEA8